MNEILEQALLFDFYGELLSERQKEVYQYYIFDNLSLGEIAAEVGMSRQGAHDLVKRSRLMLEEYEHKLHLVEKFMSIKERVQQIDVLLDAYEDICREAKPRELLEKIRQISDLIIEEF